MSFIAIYPFTTPGNYDYDEDLIEVTGGVAQLKLSGQTGQTFTEDFADDTGFTYDSDKTEFSGGQVQQKDQMPADGVIVATYNSSINANYSINGITLTGTAVNSPTIVDNKILCTGNRGVHYNHANIGFSSAFAIKFKYTPDFTGSPPAATDFISLHPGTGNNDNVIITLVSNTIRALIYNNIGAVVQAMTVVGGNVSWTSGVEKEVEINVDPINGTLKIFFDGILHGTLSPGAWTRGNSATRLWVGANPYYGNGNGSYADLVLFNSIQHTTNYIPGYSVSDTQYATDTIILPTFTYSGVGEITEFTNIVTSENNTPRYIINDQYYSGGWVASSDTWATASPIADILANIATLPASDTIIIKIVTSDNNSSQMDVSNLVLTYTDQAYPTSSPTIEPNESITMEELVDFGILASFDSSDDVTFILKKDNDWYYYNSGWVISDGSVSQSNTAEEIDTNKSTFTTGQTTVKVKAFLTSTSGQTQVELDKIEIQYDFAGTDPGAINKCIVYGHENDIQGLSSGDTVKAYLNKQIALYKGDQYIKNTVQSTTVGENGYWELELVENANMENGSKYIFNFGANIKIDKFVPNATTKRFTDLSG